MICIHPVIYYQSYYTKHYEIKCTRCTYTVSFRASWPALRYIDVLGISAPRFARPPPAPLTPSTRPVSLYRKMVKRNLFFLPQPCPARCISDIRDCSSSSSSSTKSYSRRLPSIQYLLSYKLRYFQFRLLLKLAGGGGGPGPSGTADEDGEISNATCADLPNEVKGSGAAQTQKCPCRQTAGGIRMTIE